MGRDERKPPARTGIHAIGGNMPFLGGRRIATQYGGRYAEWLTSQFAGTGGTDYVGYFFLRAAELSAERASLGLIATSALAEGDNRRTVLKPMLSEHGFVVHHAETKMPWPGSAAVLVSVLQLTRGSLETPLPVLDGAPVDSINSRLKGRPERGDPVRLTGNKGHALAGCFLRGDGFILDAAEATALLDADARNAAVVRPFIVGDDLNNAPDCVARRWVIDFFDRSLDEARAYPGAFKIVEERVKPLRERLRTTGADADHRRHWWRFANIRFELRRRTRELSRYLATARVSKHSMFAFVDAKTVPSEQVVVIPLDSWTAFTVLQSRVHGIWVELMATRMGTGLRYGAADCFETFPFPFPDPRAAIPALEAVGEELYEARSRFMSESGQGLTKVYNALNDTAQIGGACSEAVRRLREHHEALDRAALAAYGWNDIEVPPFCPSSAAERQAAQAFEDEVLERLGVLNEQRARSAARLRAERRRNRAHSQK